MVSLSMQPPCCPSTRGSSPNTGAARDQYYYIAGTYTDEGQIRGLEVIYDVKKEGKPNTIIVQGSR